MQQERNLYYPYSEYLKKKYGEKVYKLPVNLPVSCPNRQGGREGCAFCSPLGTGFEAADSSVSVSGQLALDRERIERKYHAHKFIAYFQNYTNTFLPLQQFSTYTKEAAETADIVELAVSTRPDCIREDYLDVLEDLHQKKGVEITVELGLQTPNYHTLAAVGRGHTLAEFIDGVQRVRCYGFDVCAHVILNLPGDDLSDAVECAKILSALGVQVVEAHGDAGALEGECYLVGDQGLAHAALLVAYQNRLHIAHLAIYLINYTIPYLIISTRKAPFNCHFLGFSWAFRGLETGFLASPGTARFPYRLVNERMPKTAAFRPLRVLPSKALLQVSSCAVSGPAPLKDAFGIGCPREEKGGPHMNEGWKRFHGTDEEVISSPHSAFTCTIYRELTFRPCASST